MATVGVDAIFEVQGASRAARAYAFLYSAFERSGLTASPVRDAVDCLVPFIVPFVATRPGQQLDLIKLQQFLRESFRFEIPLYAFEQITPNLVQAVDS
jgi:hypothetical protein